jgi:uncharacterized Zn finger protein (UPF0148 family)
MVVGTTDESVEKLSTKLLQGWTMLSETCPLPKCSVPLMRNRSNTEISCVQCETHFTHDFKPMGGGDYSQTVVEEPATDVKGGSAEEAEYSTIDERYDEREMPSKAAPPVEKIPRDLESNFTASSQQQGSQRGPKQGSKDDNCKGLAEKLLQGWTLTDQYCPNCLTPLVRNREKKLLCVSCDKWVITESELHANSCCGDSPNAAAADSRREEQPQPQQQPSSPLSPSVVPPSKAVGRRQASTTSNNAAAGDICKRAIDVLFSKMDLCVTKMEQGVQAIPGEEATRMVEFLNSASKTILAVNDVKDTLSL